MPRWFDTHAHLDDDALSPDRARRLDDAIRSGTVAWVVPGVRGDGPELPTTNPRGTWIGRAIGLHPWFPADPGAIARLRDTVASGDWVALGECGLDRSHRYEGDEDIFLGQLELARHHALPVILHVVREHGRVLAALDQIRPPGGVVHAFTGNPDLAREYVRRGYLLGIGHALMRSPRLQETVKTLGLSALVIESDAPTRNSDDPTRGLDLRPIAATIARLCDTDLETVATHTWDNSCRLYRLPRTFLELDPR